MEHIEQKITSMEVAEMVGKEHRKLLRDIRNYQNQLNETKIGLVDFFEESTYEDAKGEERPCFMVTKKGCEFIAHKLTGVKGTEFTAKYINRFHEMETQIKKPMTALEQIHNLFAQGLLEVEQKADTAIERITNLENKMTIDYGQQKTLEGIVNNTVIDCLGGKNSNAYHEIGKKVFAECNRDLKNYFNVNARNNVPRKRYEEACEYARTWKPCHNTMMLINNCNAQMNIE